MLVSGFKSGLEIVLYPYLKFVKLAFNVVGLNYRKHLKFNKALLRPAEVDTLRADYKKEKKTLKWIPKINFKDLVKEMVLEDLKFFK